MDDIYTPEVRIAPQHIFNSYHPITSRFMHDTWEEGKYVLAFNGVLSSLLGVAKCGGCGSNFCVHLIWPGRLDFGFCAGWE